MPCSPADFISTQKAGNVTISLVCAMSGPSPIALNIDEATWRPAVPELAATESVPFSMASAVIKTDEAVIVVDPVIDDPGSRLRDEVEDDYPHWTSSPGLQAALNLLKIANDDVSDVVITHAHFDHCLGLTVE